MRYERNHKARTRQKIAGQAARLFRREGIAAVGVRRLMADAGLTHGGFYAHYPSRADLVAEAVARALADTRASLAAAMAAAPPQGRLEALLDAYLDPRHRDSMEQGCAGAAVAPEIARHDEPVQAAFREGIDAIVDLIAAALPGAAGDGSTESAAGSATHARAMAIFALLMGSLQLARTAAGDDRSAAILQEARSAALSLAEPTSPRPEHRRP